MIHELIKIRSLLQVLQTLQMSIDIVAMTPFASSALCQKVYRRPKPCSAVNCANAKNSALAHIRDFVEISYQLHFSSAKV